MTEEQTEDQARDIPVAEDEDDQGILSRVSPVQAAIALTLVWSIAFFIPIVSNNIEFSTNISPFFTLLTFVAPVLFIWLTAIMIITMRRLKSQMRVLKYTVEHMHRSLEGELRAQAEERDSWTFFQQEQMAKLKDFVPSADTEAAHGLRTALQPFEPKPDPEELAQYGLPLAHPTELEVVPLTNSEIVHALNFPNNSDDKEGLRLMRRAAEDRGLALLIKTARQTLTALAQDGVFMEDLVPDAPQAQVWRRFAKGVRGPAIAALGGIRDRSALALTKGRLKGDVEFRETAHNLLREFDRFVLEFEKTATDDDLLSLGQTRTGRAFMLLGRCTGTFDKTS